MLEVLEERKNLRKQQEEFEKIRKTLSKNLFKNAILLLSKKGMPTAEAAGLYNHGKEGPTKILSLEYKGEISENGVSVPIHLYSRHFRYDWLGLMVGKAKLVNELAIYLEGNSRGVGNLNLGSPLNDIIIEMGDEKDAVWFSTIHGQLGGVKIFGQSVTWDRIDFVKELNAWIEQQIGS